MFSVMPLVSAESEVASSARTLLREARPLSGALLQPLILEREVVHVSDLGLHFVPTLTWLDFL